MWERAIFRVVSAPFQNVVELAGLVPSFIELPFHSHTITSSKLKILTPARYVDMEQFYSVPLRYDDTA